MTWQKFRNLNDLIAWTDELSMYVSMRNISAYIRDGDIKSAKCTADLYATKEYNDLIKCFENKSCGNYQVDLARKLAPELITNEKPFAEVEVCKE
ncbi:hypothetical protein Msip34_2370 [Methylovorus glucosotrophus SIP3-4]|uniref:Uncharacterized protein n=2 Tax=Methylovorus glucosotrophus TaxID=266009 RepID=C6XA70_METGS|nr:hypothetical protein Msip34_2370 [Methylovorus glucosotrophus SIP3-4]